MKKRLITMITIMALVAVFIVPSYGDIWNPGGADIPGAAALYLAQENGSYAVGSQLNNSGELSDGYLYIKTDVHIDGENGQLHDGKETLEVVGINGSTLDNITSMEKKSGSDWIDVTDSVMNHENAFEQKDQFTNVFRFKLDGDVQFSIQYKVLTYDTPAQYYESPKRYVQVSDGAYYYTKYEENVTTEAPSEESTEAPTEGYYNIRDYKWTSPWQYPTMEGKIFAGWFKDETLTEPYMDEDGYAYPKFIDEKALTVKMQKKEDNTAIRFVSTISRRLEDFESVGFDFSGMYGESSIDSKSKSIETVYRRITADGVTIRPNTAFDNNDSAYFVTYTIRNMDGATPSNWTVTPFYVTADGTKVTGKTATFDVVPE